MNLVIQLSSPLTEFVSQRVGARDGYNDASDYVADLIRRDKAREETGTFEALKSELETAFSQPDENAVEMDFQTFRKRHNAPAA